MAQQSPLQKRSGKHLLLRRVAAFYIDSFIYGGGGIAIMYLLDFIFPSALENKPPFVGFILAVSFVFYFGKDIFGLGKRIMKIKIYSADGTEPTALRLMARNLTLGLWPIEAAVMLKYDGRQRLGDKICDLYVDLA